MLSRVEDDALTASRDPARPASASPIRASNASSGTLRRRYRADRPSTCSAKVTAGQAGLRHKNRRAGSCLDHHPDVAAADPLHLYAIQVRGKPGAQLTGIAPGNSSTSSQSPIS